MRGFYAVLDRDDRELCRRLLEVSSVLQVRIKPGDAADILRVATWARHETATRGARLIINDRVDIALAVGADGVHLGQTDLPIEAAREIAPDLVIGVSTHNLAQVKAAVAAGADYLGYGPVFATSTKENPDPVQGIQALRSAVQAAGVTPIVAIGGITPASAAEVYATGVACICAISSVNSAPDCRIPGRALAPKVE